MFRRLRAFAPAVVLIALMLALPARSLATTPNYARVMLNSINEERADAGLPAFRRSGTLSRNAAAYARRMIVDNRWAHAGSFARGTPYLEVGEMLARCPCGPEGIPLIISALLHSPEHRSILLASRYRYAGVSVIHGLMGGQHVWVWVMRVGR